MLCATALMIWMFPSLAMSAEPADVVTVSSLEEAETLFPHKGMIESLSYERGEMVISDKHLLLADKIKYYDRKKHLVSYDRFVVGTWIGVYLNDLGRVKSMYLVDQPENVSVDDTPNQQDTITPGDSGGSGDIYLEDGVYKN